MNKGSFGPPAPLKGPDYEQIEAAVMETARGRWFLAEFARRNRTADTELLLKAIERLQNVLAGHEASDELGRLRASLMEMAAAIARLRRDLFFDQADPENGRGTPQELDAIVTETERATHKILRIGERIQEIAWTLREQGIRASICDALDAGASEIFAACSFQDLTGQKTARIVALLRMIEERLETVIDRSGLDDAALRDAAKAETREQETDSGESFEQAPKAHGPAEKPASQHEIDAMLSPPAGNGENASGTSGPEHDIQVIEIDDSEFEVGDIAVRTRPAPDERTAPDERADPDPAADEPPGMALETDRPGDPGAQEDGGDDLENFNRLSVELEAAAKKPGKPEHSVIEPGDIAFFSEDGEAENAGPAQAVKPESETKSPLPGAPLVSTVSHDHDRTSGKAGLPYAGDPRQSTWDAEFNRLSPIHRQTLFS